MILGALPWGISLLLPQGGREALTSVTEPLFNTFLGALKAVSSPLILLSVCCGILSLGDLATVGRIGKKVLSHLILVSFAAAAVTLAVFVWLFPLQAGHGAGGTGGFQGIYQMLLVSCPEI